jgi:hypothetical protein
LNAAAAARLLCRQRFDFPDGRLLLGVIDSDFAQLAQLLRKMRDRSVVGFEKTLVAGQQESALAGFGLL